MITALSLLSLASVCFAHKNPDEQTTCYIFKNDKLQSKNNCIIQSYGDTKILHILFKTNKKTFHFLTSNLDHMSEDHPTIFYETKTKTQPVTNYFRHIDTLKKLEDELLEDSKEHLYCYQSYDKKVDICSF